VNTFARTTSVGADLEPSSPVHRDLASLLEASPQGTFVLALGPDCTPVAVLVTAGCAFCGMGCNALCERLFPICDACASMFAAQAVKTHGPGEAGAAQLKLLGTSTLSDDQAEARVGVPVVFLNEDVWRGADEAEAARRSAASAAEAEPHLRVLTEPSQVHVWLEANGQDTKLVSLVLASMISSGSVLAEHAEASRALARRIRPAILRAKEVQDLTGLSVGPVDVMLDLSS
jgi:hypothetical protein